MLILLTLRDSLKQNFGHVSPLWFLPIGQGCYMVTLVWGQYVLCVSEGHQAIEECPQDGKKGFSCQVPGTALDELLDHVSSEYGGLSGTARMIRETKYWLK